MGEGSDTESSCPTLLLGRSVLSHSVEKKLEVCRMEISVLNFMQRSHKSYINLSSSKLARTPLSNTTVRDADFLVGPRVNLHCIHTTF